MDKGTGKPERIALLAAAAFLIALVCSCASQMGSAFVYNESDWERLGLSRAEVESWEDGMRTDGGREASSGGIST